MQRTENLTLPGKAGTNNKQGLGVAGIDVYRFMLLTNPMAWAITGFSNTPVELRWS